MLHGLLTIQDHPDGLKPKFSDECETIKVRMRVMVEFEHQRERPSLWSFFDLSWWSTTWALIFHQYWSHNWKLGIGGGGGAYVVGQGWPLVWLISTRWVDLWTPVKRIIPKPSSDERCEGPSVDQYCMSSGCQSWEPNWASPLCLQGIKVSRPKIFTGFRHLTLSCGICILSTPTQPMYISHMVSYWILFLILTKVL